MKKRVFYLKSYFANKIINKLQFVSSYSISIKTQVSILSTKLQKCPKLSQRENVCLVFDKILKDAWVSSLRRGCKDYGSGSKTFL